MSSYSSLHLAMFFDCYIYSLFYDRFITVLAICYTTFESSDFVSVSMEE